MGEQWEKVGFSQKEKASAHEPVAERANFRGETEKAWRSYEEEKRCPNQPLAPSPGTSAHCKKRSRIPDAASDEKASSTRARRTPN